MSAREAWEDNTDLIGTVWRINDSGTRFMVVAVEGRYVQVENVANTPRRRRILLAALRASKAKTGYTQIVTEVPS